MGKSLLQIAVALACLVPLGIGGAGVLLGPGIVGAAPGQPDLDSHFRYLSGVFLGVGVGFASCVPHIERMGPRFRLLGAFVVLGGLSRALGWAEHGAPSIGHRLGLVMELGVTPLLMLWQARVAWLPRGEE